MYVLQSSFIITNSAFTHNRAPIGGVMSVFNSSFDITKNIFTNNTAVSGGIFSVSNCLIFHIVESIFSGNDASQYGGVAVIVDSSFNVTSSIFTNNTAANDGGVIITLGNAQSSCTIVNSTFISNRVTLYGGVIYTSGSSFSIIISKFMNNTAVAGGVLFAHSRSAFTIIRSTFKNNIATLIGGVFTAFNSSFSISTCSFTNNSAVNSGVIQASINSTFSIVNSTYTSNSATKFGGIVGTSGSSFVITTSNFSDNRAGNSSGVINAQSNSSFSINFSVFTNNSATSGGVIAMSESFFSVNNCNFTENHAIVTGGVMTVGTSIFTVSNSTFTSNSVSFGGGVITVLFQSSFNVTDSIFIDNSAIGNGSGGGVLLITSPFLVNSSTTGTLINSTFYNNSGYLGGVMNVWGSSILIVNGKFDSNWGSLLVFSSNITFSGLTVFENSVDAPNKIVIEGSGLHAGAFTSFKSDVFFTGVSRLSNNQARYGGAISATDSKITVYGEMTIGNNTATIGPGGGVYIQKSVVDIKGSCIIYNNFAISGGGIYATSSTINIYVPGSLHFIENEAIKEGGGVYFETNPKLNLLKPPGNFDKLLTFTDNHARLAGGAIFVNDYKNSALCSSGTDCFIQILGFNDISQTNPSPAILNIFFSGNTATTEENGSNIYGGILDRCIPSLYAAIHLEDQKRYTGITYLKMISNITVDSIKSKPLKLCFCTREGQPNCQLQPPPIRVKRGETFTISIIAVDQVTRAVSTHINSSLIFPNSGFAEGQQTQKVNINCTELIFNVYSSEDNEQITLYADGPCGSSASSVRHVDINFINCTCSVGFEKADNSPTRCDCICDSALFPYITNCNYTTKSLLRETNSWIAYSNDTDPPGFTISPNCPLDYCHPQTEKINYSLPTGVDRQCAYDRMGVLCGACKENFSLSLGSSRCLPCPSYWPAIFVAVVLASAVAGALLVIGLAIFNITVATGLINGIIFYANIIAAIRSDIVLSTEPIFPTVFIAWLNFDLGFDFCFLNGLDTYIKTWLQLAFPVYIIALFVIVTKLCSNLSSFNYLVGSEKGDKILATLILLSYAKLLSVTTAILSFTALHYPDGSRVMVWLPDGNVQYFQGKHIVLVVAAFVITVIGAPYTLFVFLWQWLSDEKLLKTIKNTKIKSVTIILSKWIKSTKLNDIITKYYSPLNPKHRYWTGLLLLVRVVLYITAAVANSGNPQLPLLMAIILIGGLFFLKTINGTRLYSSIVVDTIETVIFLNLLTFTSFSLYRFNADNTKQIIIAYISTLTTFLILVGVVVYHIYLFISKKRMAAQQNRTSINDLGTNSPKNEVTYSVVEISRPPSPLVETNGEQMSIDSDNEGYRSKSAPHEYNKCSVDSEDVNDSHPLLDEIRKTV